MKKTIAVIGTVVGIFVGAIAGRYTVQVLFHGRNEALFEQSLVEFSKAINATLPIHIDRETRLDATIVGPGLRLTYLYTLVDVSADDFDGARFIEIMKPRLINGYKTNPDMATLRGKDVKLHYQYRDAAGTIVATIDVSPNEF